MQFYFRLEGKEERDADLWKEKHLETCTQKQVGAAGGRFTYAFTPTGIGVCIVVKCCCGEEKNVTDYSGW